ncbi:MAG: hypothetical protein PF487_03125 [Bacteroidales bacterium]|jgi:hypothetical protein|nr:hypothetical protein [Bacteroidales bacterium]
MFESRLRTISKYIFKDDNKVSYFILTHKKHAREMYFKIKDKDALIFAKSKFNSRKKRVIFFLLKLGILQPFLRKIRLSKEIGDVVFVGGQIKGFDLKNRVVNSFYHVQGDAKTFIKDKISQIKLGEEGFAPKIIFLDSLNIFSREHLFAPYLGINELLFDRLLEFHKTSKMQEVKSSLIIKEVKKYLTESKIDESLFNAALKKIKDVGYFIQTRVHGEFAKEQCLINKGKIFFVDWSLRHGVITEDLVNFFRLDDSYFNKKEFKSIIKKYPNHVKDNLREYLLLTELVRISQGINNLDLSKKRIEKLLNL